MNKARRCVDAAVGSALALLMAVAVLAVVWQVVSRYVLRNPSSMTEELTRYALIWITLIGAAFAVGSRQHLAIALIEQRLSEIWRHRLARILAVGVIVFAVVVLLWGGSRLVYITWRLDQRSAAMGLRLGVVYLALPISGLLMLFYSLAQLFGDPAEVQRGATQEAT